jgi:hypothetical protein
MSLGMASNATEADFCFVPQKVPFSFSECRNQVFKKGILKKEVSSMKNNDFQAE